MYTLTFLQTEGKLHKSCILKWYTVIVILIGKLLLDVVMNLECGKLRLVHRFKTLAAELQLQVATTFVTTVHVQFSIVSIYDIHTLDTQVDVHVSSLCFSPDGTHLAAGLSTGEVQVLSSVYNM